MQRASNTEGGGKHADPENGEPVCLNSFYQKHPLEFIGAPIAVALCAFAAWRAAPEFIEQQHLKLWGADSLQYVGFTILLTFAFHGWMCIYFETVLRSRKLQPPGKDGCPWLFRPLARAGTRSTAVMLTNSVYVCCPLRPPSTSWLSFFGYMLVLMLLRDAWFFLSHLAFHEVRWLYKHVHKLHHRMTESTALGAYYVTYWDHFLYEQIATFLLSTFLIPGDVLIIYMYLGVFETLAQHSGTHLDDLRLPLVPMFTVGHARSLMGFFVGNLIGNGMETEHHDWHHEKGWTQNYGFSFTFLDKLFGTFHGGRRPWREGESPFRDAERKLD